MVSSEYLVSSEPADRETYRVRPEERPAALQIVGARPAVMVEAAAMLVDLGADVLDINMGCPVRKIVEGGGGAALMKAPALAATIVAAIKARVGVPVTAKMRAGWDGGGGEAVVLARALEDAGVDAIAVHARTRESRHRGAPLLPVLAAVKQSVSVPVIGNGGIGSPEDAVRMLTESGCDGVMIGRAGIGDVFVFERIARFIEGGEEPPPPSGDARAETLCEHLRLLIEEEGEEKAVILFRKCIPHYLKGMRGAREARQRLCSAGSAEEVTRTARQLLASAD
jgi:nifR3 family TIM-barrel protein